MSIEGVRGSRATGATVSRGAVRAGASGFSMPAEVSTASTSGAGATVGVSAAGILALQGGAEETVGDRPARRRGQEMLTELASLQREMLGANGPSISTLRRLARLAETLPQATTPELQDAVEQIRLRAVVELARYGIE